MKQTGFSRRDSLAVKGAAILLMIFLHCFRVPQLYEGFSVNFFPFPEDLVNRISTYCKICVGIFVFISGYGLAESCRDVPDRDLSRAAAKRWYRSMAAFWPIYVLSLLAGVILDDRTFTLYFAGGPASGVLNLLWGALGLSHLFRTPMFVNEWWYLSAMVVFLFAAPLFQRWVHRFGWALPLFLLIALPRVFSVGFLGGTEIPTFFFALMLGVIFSEYRLFDRLWNLLRPGGLPARLAAVLLSAALAFAGYKAYFRLPAGQYWEILYGLIPLSFLLFFHLLIKGIPLAESFFVFLGRHSGNMYFVHTVFLYVYLKDFLYRLPWFGLTPLVLTALSLSVSLLLEAAKGLLHSHICKKENKT